MNGSAENPAQDFLDEEFSASLRHLLPSALRRAYAAASRVIDSEAFLQTPAGRLQRGDLIAHAAEYEVFRLIQTKVLPMEASWEPYAKPTGRHLVVWTKRGRLTVNQVKDWRKQPRFAEFRSNYAISNMQDLFAEVERNRELDNERKHLLLLHGYGSLNFCYLTVPHSAEDFHLARSPNLMLTPHIASTERSAEEGPTDSPDPETIESLRKVIRDAQDD